MKALLLISFLWLSGLSSTSFAGTPGEVEVGGFLRDAQLRGLSGQTRKFSDYLGKPLIINVWASYCGPCRAEMGSLERLSRRSGNKFNVIGISVDDYFNAAVSFVRQTKVTFENYIDSKLFLENMLGANAIPLTVLVDAKGRMVEKVRGSHEWDSPEAVKFISAALRLKL